MFSYRERTEGYTLDTLSTSNGPKKSWKISKG
jgi:hypothetical protein